jgi:two-component system sensor histidine kinase DegS
MLEGTWMGQRDQAAVEQSLEELEQIQRALAERAASPELANFAARMDAALAQVREGLASAREGRGLGIYAIWAQEEERRRFAREIHDGPAQLLNSVVLRIDVCQRLVETDPQRLALELPQLKELVRLSLQDVRKLIFDLRPMALDDLGLVPALRILLKDHTAKSGIQGELTVNGTEARFDGAVEVALFRLVQEALTNVAKHSGASKVTIRIDLTDPDQIHLTVTDDGVGFDLSTLRQQGAAGRFGLVSMRERAELLGGRLTVVSARGAGTTLQIQVPRWAPQGGRAWEK